MKPWQQQQLRQLPPVNAVLAELSGAAYSHERKVAAINRALAEVRQGILSAATEPAGRRAAEPVAGGRGGEPDPPLDPPTPSAVAQRALSYLAQESQPRLKHVINATGIVLHTNLGRAPLAKAAIQAITETAQGYSNLELDLATGERGSRYSHVEELLTRLTGAEAALVVNNNAGAVLLALSALAKGKEVIVSRGELVEIGGSFRIPAVMEQGGASLHEVGTTNKTHKRDYEEAINENTGALLKVHASNYKIIGFTQSVEIEELKELGKTHGLPVLADWGSGLMLPALPNLPQDELTMPELIKKGADLVMFSGDKLLGGPQAGILVGNQELIKRCKEHPLTRALRIDKLSLAALEATLRLYLEPAQAIREIPILARLSANAEALAPLAETLAQQITQETGLPATVADGVSQAGGGSLPGHTIATKLVAVKAKNLNHLETRLRDNDPPILARIQNEALLFDVRALWPDELPAIVKALKGGA